MAPGHLLSSPFQQPHRNDQGAGLATPRSGSDVTPVFREYLGRCWAATYRPMSMLSDARQMIGLFVGPCTALDLDWGQCLSGLKRISPRCPRARCACMILPAGADQERSAA